MGGETSTCEPSEILNLSAREFFESIIRVIEGQPESFKKQKSIPQLKRTIFDSLKNVPSNEKEFGFMITGPNMGPLFVESIMGRISLPEALTKVSLRKSSLRPNHSKSLAEFLMKYKHIKQFDVSENEFGDQGHLIILSAIAHPSLTSFQIESSHLTESSVVPIQQLLAYNRKIETLRVGPIKADNIISFAKNNSHLTNINLDKTADPETDLVCDRNSFIYEFVDSISRSPFQRQFRTKIDAFKSVKGREMVMGRASQKEKAKGTDLFNQMEQTDQRARTTEVAETVERVDRFRSGHAEMIGRRPAMEDVTITLQNSPKPKSVLFGVFDGHGGREAAEYASIHLPESISDYLKRNDPVETAFTNAFRRIQMDMKPWCVYVGSTACVVTIEDMVLSVANIGDTRCVLCRDGKAMRLSVDHKPDLPEETSYIQSKGGFVRDGRVGGMLAVSRAFGDGFLGDCVNPTPYFKQLPITEADRFLIIACDGVWDVMSDQQAVDLVLPEIDPLVAAKKLRDQAFELESTDNISVVVVFLSEALAIQQ